MATAERVDAGESGDPAPGSQVMGLLLIAGTMNVAWDLVTPFVPLFVLMLEGGDTRSAAFWSGIAVGISPLFTAIAGPFWGAMAERLGGRTSMLRTIATSSVLVALMSLTTAVWQLVGLRVLVGALGGFYVLIHVLAARASPRDRVGQTIGSLQAINMACLAVVPPIAGYFVDLWGLRSNFLLGSAIMILAFVMMYRLRIGAGPGEEGRHAGPRESYWKMLASGDVLVIASVVFASQFVDRAFMALAPLLVFDLVGESDQVGLLTGTVLGLSAGSTAVAAMAVGRLSRRYPPRRLLIGALMCGLAILPLLAGAQTVWTLLAMRVVFGLLAGGALTLAYAWAGALISPERLSACFSAFASTAMVASAIGPVSLGISAGGSLRAPLYVGVGLILVSLVAVLRKRDTEAPVAPQAVASRSGAS
ncbi:MAG: MFS transporter [Chloroflexota bacterium]